MDTLHSPRHTRRGFLRGDSSPKFFKIELPAANQPVLDFRPPASEGVAPPVSSNALPLAEIPIPPQTDVLNFDPSLLEKARGASGASTGNAFLAWLADQITGEAGSIDDFLSEESDPHLDSVLTDYDSLNEDLLDDELLAALDLSFGVEAAYAAGHEDEIDDSVLGVLRRSKEHPEVTLSPDGGRSEVFGAGSRVVKDVLGRVVEVHSQYGESLFFRYGELGNMEFFERFDVNGRSHSQGRKDRHGVVVRDHEGRVRAAGETMAVDPRGCFSLHSIDGQFFSLDLVTGIHTERRRVNSLNGEVKFVTSLFTHDGFRMATMFTRSRVAAGDTISGEQPLVSSFRFYGRDGTTIDFKSEDDLRELRPERSTRPASSKVSATWLQHRQASTAWESVHDYLMRVS